MLQKSFTDTWLTSGVTSDCPFVLSSWTRCPLEQLMPKINMSSSLITRRLRRLQGGSLDTGLETETWCFPSVTCGLWEANVATVSLFLRFPATDSTLGEQISQCLQGSLKHEQGPDTGAGRLPRSAASLTACLQETIH